MRLPDTKEPLDRYKREMDMWDKLFSFKAFVIIIVIGIILWAIGIFAVIHLIDMWVHLLAK